jgi:hypothetical protein
VNGSSFTLATEPKGDLYFQLIDYLASKSELALLIVRDYAELEEGAKRLLERLEPFLQRREESNQWPGTILGTDKAEVFYYTPVPEFIGILKIVSSSLYQWQHPLLPEDLCFLRQSGEPWFTSIAHENDAYFSLSEEEFRALHTEVPEIARILRKDEV